MSRFYHSEYTLRTTSTYGWARYRLPLRRLRSYENRISLDKIKWEFCTTWTLTKRLEKKLDGITQ